MSIVLDMPETEYHAHPALSSTGARQLLVAPAKFAYEQAHTRPSRPEFDLGTAVHTKVLGTGWNVVVIPEELLGANGSVSTKAAKEFVANARLDGLVPVKASVAETVNAMSESVLAHKDARVILEQAGNAEVSVFGECPTTGVEIRARFDFLSQTEKVVGADLKTTAGEASPEAFARSVGSFGYHIQEAHYRDAALFADHPVEAFVFIVVEKEPPYLTAVHVLDQDYQDIGRERALEARRRFRTALDTDEWPGYPDGIQIVRPPNYIIYDHIDRGNAA
ncbi:PD-(D/E)XK nuclease-like domain-containing protein [Microbacterium sp. YY-01]|uniref:PD-(D/E)XK nuclease-like domain-containing protein n=1 Tax=Microbacterium sp. YY-01 TaxID=3421634 RepID=UPI003D1863BF